MNKQEAKQTISEYVTSLIIEGSLKPDKAPDLVNLVNNILVSRETFTVENIGLLVKEWETKMGPEDNTLYTLGLRRAVDVITETSYKPLSPEDFRDFKRPFDLPPRETDDSSN